MGKHFSKKFNGKNPKQIRQKIKIKDISFWVLASPFYLRIHKNLLPHKPWWLLQGQKLTGAQSPMALDFGLGYKTFTYNLVKHIDIFFIKNLVWATSLNFPISIPVLLYKFESSYYNNTLSIVSSKWKSF